MSDRRRSAAVDQSSLVFLGILATVTIGVVAVFVLSGKGGAPGPATESSGNPTTNNDGFLGDRGTAVEAVGGKVYIDESKVSDGDMRSFNYYSEKEEKTIYFFIVRASDGTYRAAANACEVCFMSRKGFKQIGDQIRCENCQTLYSKDQIALQKGGCNPRPIDRDVKVVDDRLVISLLDIEKSADLF